MKLQDINERIGVQVTTFVDRNPQKRCDSMMYLERVDGTVVAEVTAAHPGSYHVAHLPQSFDIDQNWLDQRQIKTFGRQEFAAETIKVATLNFLIEEINFKSGFHPSSFAKHEVDNAGGKVYPADSSRLQIAKLEKPFELELKNGKTIGITHVSNIGELIYKAQGLKSVPFEQATLGGIDQLARGIADGPIKLAPAIESSLNKYKDKALLRENSNSPSLSM